MIVDHQGAGRPSSCSISHDVFTPHGLDAIFGAFSRVPTFDFSYMILNVLQTVAGSATTWKEALVTACKRLGIVVLDFERSRPVFVYQMGKVGSMSVYTSLKRARLGRPIFHLHFLHSAGLDRAERFYRENKVPRPPEHIRTSRTLARKLVRTKRALWTIVTLVRDPVERDVSGYFQHAEWRSPHLRYRDGRVLTDHAGAFVADLLERFQRYDEATDYACTWFEDELERVFGVDVYAQPFDHERGFSIIRTDTAEVLVIRLSDLDRVFQSAMTEFLGLRGPITLVRTNETGRRAIAQVYQEVLRLLRLDRPTCERIYGTRLARHFFTDRMREAAIDRWTRGPQSHADARTR